MIEREIDQPIAEQESSTLVAINTALQVLHHNPELYGVCRICGEPISTAQLSFEPWSSRCDIHAEEHVQ